MTNWGGLPPIDVGGWADYQRKRMQQEAAQRIAAAGAVAQDWQSKANRAIEGITAGAGAAAQVAGGRIEQIGQDVQQGIAGIGPGIQEAGSAAFGGLQDIGQATAQTIGQTFANPTDLGLAPPGETPVQTRGNAMFPDDPFAGIKYAGVQTGLGINQAQEQSQAAFDAMMGFGPQGPNLAAQAAGGLDVATTPYTAGSRATTAAATNLGASPEAAAVAGGVAGTFGPGGITSNIVNRDALPIAGAILGGATGVGTGIAQGRPADELITRGFEGAQMGAGAGEILPKLGAAGADALRYGVSRFGADEGDAARAVAGRGRATTGSRFGIENARPDDIEGQVMAQGTGTTEEVRRITGAPGSRTDAPGTPRTSSPLSPLDPSLPERSVAEFVDGKRTAATPYEYLKGLAQDYATYRDFYPGFGRFYKQLADPAGGQADGLFNELGALWGATAAQTAPHDNLTKALTASIAARRFRDQVGRLPNPDELYKLLMDGEMRPGLRVTRTRANPNQGVQSGVTVDDPGEFMGHDPVSQLRGSARKLTMDDARKIVDTWDKGQITIPTNFKLSAFNILNALAARGEYSPFSVIDTHMFRLLGYGDEARRIKPGDLAGNPTASRYTQAQVARLADDLGWEPHQVQSALWFGAKEEVAPRSGFTGSWTLENDIPETGNLAGETVEIGGLPYSIDKNRKLIDDFKAQYAPEGPINDLSGQAAVVFPGARSGRGMPTFGLDAAAQERANVWMENRGYTFTVDVSEAEAQALGFDPATGKIAALEARGVPAIGQRTADGALAVQLYTTSDEAAKAASETVTGITRRGEPIRPIRPASGADEGVARPATDTAFQIDKADGTPWTAPEVAAARQAGVPIHASPDGRSLVARAADLGEGVDEAAIREALEAAGAPPLAVSGVPVRAPLGLLPSEGAVGRSVDGGLGEAARAGAQQMLPAGAARTGGEAAFDLGAGAAGGVAGAATAPEDATWQERAKRGLLGLTAASMAGPTARAGLGALGRSGALDRLGVAAGAAGSGQGSSPGGLTKLGAATQIAQATPLASLPSLGWNALGGVARTAQRFAQDSIGNLDSPSSTIADLMGMGASLPKALSETRNEFLNISPQAAAIQGSVPGGLTDSNALWARILTGGTRANAATDKFFSTLNQGGARARSLSRGGTAGEADAAATKAGDFASFLGQNSPIADALVGAGRWANDPSLPMAKRLLGAGFAGFAPYVRTPERIMVATARLATDPVTQTLYALPKAILKGDKPAMREAVGRMGVAIPLTGLFLHDYLSGDLRGDPPANPTERRKQEAQGAKWNTWRGMPLTRIGPVGGAASAVATSLAAGERALLRGEHPADVGRDVAGAMGKWALSNSYLDDLQNFSEDVASGRLAQGVEKQAVGMGTRAFSPVTSAIGAFDPVERAREGTGQELLYKLPGGRFALPERIDPATGGPMRRRGNWASRYAGLAQGDVTSPEGDALNRYGIKAPTYQAGDDYQGGRLTGDQARQLSRASGSEVNREVRAALNSSEFSKADDEGKVRLLRAAMTRARSEADIAGGPDLPRDPENRAKREWQAVPKFRGVDGTPDEVRRLNARISRAKAALSAAKSKGRDAESDWKDAHPDEYELTRYAELPATRLKQEREEIEAKYPGVDLGG